MTKGFSIPAEYLWYYPPVPTTPNAIEEIPMIESGELIKKKRGQKAQQTDTMKVARKSWTLSTVSANEGNRDPTFLRTSNNTNARICY
jgi:hypothetical protein